MNAREGNQNSTLNRVAMNLTSINPSNGKKLKEYKSHTEEEVVRKIELSHKSWAGWKKTPFEKRAELLNTMAQVLLSRKEDFGLLMANEMGKPIGQGIAEIEKCAACCTY